MGSVVTGSLNSRVFSGFRRTLSTFQSQTPRSQMPGMRWGMESGEDLWYQTCSIRWEGSLSPIGMRNKTEEMEILTYKTETLILWLCPPPPQLKAGPTWERVGCWRSTLGGRGSGSPRLLFRVAKSCQRNMVKKGNGLGSEIRSLRNGPERKSTAHAWA